MENTWKDYYEILGVDFESDDATIKSAYLNLMKKYHPDSEFADEEKTKEINEAYSVLGDPEKKIEYDQNYMQYKNGNYEEEEDFGVPKYSHEEMHQEFTEEEIRFAKKMALQQVITETLEKAKIIIDAKNELLFAAFNDNYVEETYLEDYDLFIKASYDYLDELKKLIEQAIECNLEAEKNTIEEVISFLQTVINSIPKTLIEAKKYVKRELMKEQLQMEAQELLSESERVYNEFINLYKSVYENNLSQDEFILLFNSKKIELIDVGSKIEEIYELLNKAKLTEEFNKVGLTIGKLKEAITIYSGDYSVAKKIGKRLVIKDYLEKKILSFDEYKEKVLNLMKEIINDPFSENHEIRVNSARKLYDEYQKRSNISDDFRKENDDYLVKMSSLNKDVVDIYNCRKKLYDKVSEIFSQTELKHVDNYSINILKNWVSVECEEIEAVKLLQEVYILYGQYTELNAITDLNFKNLFEKLEQVMKRSNELDKLLSQIDNYIYLKKNRYESVQEHMNFLSTHTIDDINNLREKSVKKGVFDFIAGTGVLTTGFILGDYFDSYLFFVGLTGSILLFGDFAKCYINDCMFLEKMGEYRQFFDEYNALLNGSDTTLKDIYEKALKV